MDKTSWTYSMTKLKVKNNKTEEYKYSQIPVNLQSLVHFYTGNILFQYHHMNMYYMSQPVLQNTYDIVYVEIPTMSVNLSVFLKTE